MEVSPGRAVPGATWNGQATNFAVSAGGADAVELCLFEGGVERRIALPARTGSVWHGAVAGVGPGQRYGFRASGPFEPSRGLWYNPGKLLLDPYARAISGTVAWHPSLFDGNGAHPDDTAPRVPRSVVIDAAFDWSGDRRPEVPWADTVVYELHVKGLTAAHPDVPPRLRGTYAGLAHPAVLEHLTTLGVTTVELLPVHHFVPEPAVVARGLTNYWGYCPIGYFAPHGPYAATGDGGSQVAEFKAMVKALHAVGLEVILDVVYNHTAEGGVDGPTLCHRGLDNTAYYRLAPGDPATYVDVTGTGNTLDARHPTALGLILDSLRYWVEGMHVDGFRFDLATALVRGEADFDEHAPLLEAVGNDPVLAGAKLVAEPWDTGPGGYQLGRFPARWSEWNDRYRDGVRDFWRGRAWSAGDLGFRLTGSSDLYRAGGRLPTASINFVTAHDGFTLHDLVAYDRKHNLAYGEDGRDGTDDNRSWNCGAEGETADPVVLGLRRRQQRNLMATLLLSQGVPMLLAGDELDRTQRGNNNPYCHDGPLGWVDWTLDEHALELYEFTKRLIGLRRSSAVLRRNRFFDDAGLLGDGTERPEIGWYAPGGAPMREGDWSTPGATALGMLLNGSPDSLLVLLNGAADAVRMVLPDLHWATAVTVVVDTAHWSEGMSLRPGASIDLESRSLVVCRVEVDARARPPRG